MPDFHYQALNAEQEPVNGQLRADDVQQAVAKLESDGLTVQSIEVAATEPPSDSVDSQSVGGAAAKGSLEENFNVFSSTIEHDSLRSHVSTVLERGKTLVPALKAYAEEMPLGRRRQQLLSVLQVIDRGDLAEAMAAFDKLPDYWIPLLSTTAASRDPGRVLREFLDESRKADELSRQWWLTFAYPIFVAGTAAVVLTILSFLVIPLFREMFTDFDLELPQFTLFVLALGEWVVGGQILIVVAVLIVIGVLLPNMHRLLPSLSARLSSRFAAPFGRRTAIARFARFTADLLEAGLDIPAALRMAGFASRRSELQRTAWQMAHDMALETGSGGDRDGRQNLGRYPLASAVLHVLQADMSNTSRVHLLREISACHTERAGKRLSSARGIVEPVTIIVVGFIVGSIVLALFLPLINLISGLAG